MKICRDAKVAFVYNSWKEEQLMGYCGEGPLLFIVPRDLERWDAFINITKMYSGFVDTYVIYDDKYTVVHAREEKE